MRFFRTRAFVTMCVIDVSSLHMCKHSFKVTAPMHGDSLQVLSMRIVGLCKLQ